MQAEIQGDGVLKLRAFLAKRGHKLNATADEKRVTAQELRQSSEWLRELRKNDATTPTLRSFLQGSVVQPRILNAGEEPSEQQKQYLAKRRQKLMRLDEEARYGNLVKNVKTQTESKELQRSLTSAKQHMSIGANMVVSRIVAFIVIYIASRPLTDNETTRIIAGLGGAIGMMFVEMVLFITRAAKYESIERSQKMKHEGVFES